MMPSRPPSCLTSLSPLCGAQSYSTPITLRCIVLAAYLFGAISWQVYLNMRSSSFAHCGPRPGAHRQKFDATLMTTVWHTMALSCVRLVHNHPQSALNDTQPPPLPSSRIILRNHHPMDHHNLVHSLEHNRPQ